MLQLGHSEWEINLDTAVVQHGVDQGRRDRVELHDVVFILPGAGRWEVGPGGLLHVILRGLGAAFW